MPIFVRGPLRDQRGFPLLLLPLDVEGVQDLLRVTIQTPNFKSQRIPMQLFEGAVKVMGEFVFWGFPYASDSEEVTPLAVDPGSEREMISGIW